MACFELGISLVAAIERLSYHPQSNVRVSAAEWVAPVIGASLAGATYHTVFAAKPEATVGAAVASKR